MASPKNEAPAGVPPGLGKSSFPGGTDSRVNAPKAHIAQARIDQLVDDITDTAGWLVTQLSVLPSQCAAADYSGMLYTLRRSRCYWRHISESAAQLATANDERLSAIRQDGRQ
jgi:hypothetical protein